MKSPKTIQDILDFITDQDTFMGANGFDDVINPFEISPYEYLEFAEIDIENKTKHGLINALSNAKRALDSRLECVLFSFGLLKSAKKKRLTVPAKIDLLSSLNVLAPRVLRKINKVRNYVEHEFSCPSIEEVEDFIDIVSLFLESTKIYLYHVPNEIEYETEKSDNFVCLKIVRDTPEFIVSVGRNEPFKVNSSHNLYNDFIKEYVGTIYSNYIWHND